MKAFDILFVVLWLFKASSELHGWLIFASMLVVAV